MAITFEALRMYDVLNLEGHINVKQYCDSLLTLTAQRHESSEVHIQNALYKGSDLSNRVEGTYEVTSMKPSDSGD